MKQLQKMTMGDYQAAEGISKSGLDQIAKSPAHYAAWKQQKPEPSRAMIFGSALHCALLEPELFKGEYALSPDVDKRTKAGKEEFAAWEASNGGKVSLTANEWQKVTEMQQAFQSHALVSGILKDAHTEGSAFWQDKLTGVQCKARPDIVVNGLILDLKTTEDASRSAFEKSAANFRYHCQASFYLTGLSEVTGSIHKDFLFIAIEKTAPYAIAVYKASAEMLQFGHECNNRDLTKYAAAYSSGVWSGYPEEVQSLSLPPWAI